MQVGEPYNPLRLFYGAFVPEWLLTRPELSQGAKLCFGRLMQLAGGRGQCDPDAASLARDLGVQRRQATEYLRELKDLRLIACERRGLGRSNVYSFTWHEWAEACALRPGRPEAQRSAGSDEPQSARPDARRGAQPEGGSAAPPHDLRRLSLEEGVKAEPAAAAPREAEETLRRHQAFFEGLIGFVGRPRREELAQALQFYRRREEVIDLPLLQAVEAEARASSGRARGAVPVGFVLTGLAKAVEARAEGRVGARGAGAGVRPPAGRSDLSRRDLPTPAYELRGALERAARERSGEFTALLAQFERELRGANWPAEAARQMTGRVQHESLVRGGRAAEAVRLRREQLGPGGLPA